MERIHMQKRIIETKITSEDTEIENSLRPTHLSDYIGQKRIKESLLISIQAAKQRKEPLDHLLFYGPPGLGKTTLAGIIAKEMGRNLRPTSGPAFEKPGELAAVLNGLGEGDILFIDEIHRLNKQVEEILYPAMEDYAIDILVGQGPNTKSIHLQMPKFTLVGATTRAGLLSAPLRDRFGEIHRLEFYSDEELCTIVINSAKRLRTEIDTEAAMEIAKRSRGTPRIANRMLKRVRDFAQVRYDGKITGKVADTALERMEVDEMGLDKSDKRLLLTLINSFGGGPAGLDTLAASIGEDSGTIEDLIEPYLLQKGLLNRTPRGRVVTEKAYTHLGINTEKMEKG